ncbi:EAL domain-containing response regulator [Leptospira sp. 96542]|nr:EAL domain-containing response regulator [Leptospira sp. 96542]
MAEFSAFIALVVEDSLAQRAHLVAMLRQFAFGQIIEASDGREALQAMDALGGARIYLLITDVDMPGMDGIELIAKVTERQCIDNLVVTSARDPRLLETVESLVVEDVRLQLLGTLPKPITLHDLRRLLGRARASEAIQAQQSFASQDIQEIEQALAAQQFIPYVQPKVEMGTGLLKGVEMLARWQHPTRGLLGPAAFIPSLEGSPLMARFTLAIVEQALRLLAQWHRAMPTLTVSVNLSADDLADRSFVDQLTATVSAHAVPCHAVIWEVTETAILNKQALVHLARLGLKGFGLSIDDFGIGYSSIQTLSRSPFTELKIDRVFVNGASTRSNRYAILSSALDMGQRLGVTTVAEGVETVADWRLLRKLGCQVAQGYLIAKPMPPQNLWSWIRSDRARLRALAQGDGSVRKRSDASRV